MATAAPTSRPPALPPRMATLPGAAMPSATRCSAHGEEVGEGVDLVEQLAVEVPAPAQLAPAPRVGRGPTRRPGRAGTAGRSRTTGAASTRRRRSRRAPPARCRRRACPAAARRRRGRGRRRAPWPTSAPRRSRRARSRRAPGSASPASARRCARSRRRRCGASRGTRTRSGRCRCGTRGCRRGRPRAPPRRRPARARAPSSNSTRSRGMASCHSCSTTKPSKASTLVIRRPGTCGARSVQVARPGSRHGRGHDAEVLGVEVGEDDEAVALVVDAVLVVGRPRLHDDRLGLGLARPDERRLARGLALAGQQHDLLAAAQLDAQEEPLVVLLEHEHVVGLRRAQPVAPHLVGPHGLVGDHVEEVRLVRRPGGAVVGALEHVVGVAPGGEVAEPHGEDLVAAGVGRPRQQAAAGAHVERARGRRTGGPRPRRSGRGASARRRRRPRGRRPRSGGRGWGTTAPRPCGPGTTSRPCAPAPTGRSPGCGA